MDIQELLPVFRTVVDVVNENNERAKITNNFSKLKIQTIDPA